MPTAKCGCRIGRLGAYHDADCGCTHRPEPELVCRHCKQKVAAKDAAKKGGGRPRCPACGGDLDEPQAAGGGQGQEA